MTEVYGVGLALTLALTLPLSLTLTLTRALTIHGVREIKAELSRRGVSTLGEA